MTSPVPSSARHSILLRGLCRYFEVCSRSENGDTRVSRSQLTRELFLRDKIKQDLAQKTAAVSKSRDPVVTLPYKVDVSLWLKVTRSS
jgi:hypothetical protein